MKPAATPALESDLGTVLPGLRLCARLLTACGAGMAVFDGMGRLVVWNGLLEQLTGVRAEAAEGRRAADALEFLAGGSSDHGPERFIDAALSGRTVALREQPYVSPAAPQPGPPGLVDAYFVPVPSAEGAIVGGALVVHDISERQRAAEQLGESERRFRIMADAAPVLLWMSETDGLCTFFNQTWLDFTGRTLAEEWGVGWAELVHGDDLQRCLDTYLSAFNRRQPFEMEYRLRRRDGAYRWILDRGVARFTPSGSFAGYIGSCIDITERKELEAELCKAVRDRDDFLSVAAHELRTPMNSLQLQGDSLKRTLERSGAQALVSGKLASGVQMLQQQTARLQRLVEELLDMSRLASGRPQLERDEVDLAVVVRTVATRLSRIAEEQSCQLELHLASTVGRWDRARLEQVVANLLGNALKYGAGKPVSVSVEKHDGTARLVVRDQGIGISPEDQERIFERFTRAVPLRNYGGFGLGLWIARALIDAHGGRISVHSRPGEGATFVVELPRQQ